MMYPVINDHGFEFPDMAELPEVMHEQRFSDSMESKSIVAELQGLFQRKASVKDFDFAVKKLLEHTTTQMPWHDGEHDIIIVRNEDNSFTFDKEWDNVFCFGYEVDDTHILDKQKLFALNFSATQGLARIMDNVQTDLSNANTTIQQQATTIQQQATTIQEQATKITTLETQIADILTRLSNLENTGSA